MDVILCNSTWTSNKYSVQKWPQNPLLFWYKGEFFIEDFLLYFSQCNFICSTSILIFLTLPSLQRKRSLNFFNLQEMHSQPNGKIIFELQPVFVSSLRLFHRQIRLNSINVDYNYSFSLIITQTKRNIVNGNLNYEKLST